MIQRQDTIEFAYISIGKARIRFKVAVAGRGLRSPLVFRLLVEKSKLDEILKLVQQDRTEKALKT